MLCCIFYSKFRLSNSGRRCWYNPAWSSALTGRVPWRGLGVFYDFSTTFITSLPHKKYNINSTKRPKNQQQSLFVLGDQQKQGKKQKSYVLLSIHHVGVKQEESVTLIVHCKFAVSSGKVVPVRADEHQVQPTGLSVAEGSFAFVQPVFPDRVFA